MFERGVPTPVTYIRYIGVWDMQDLYEAMVDWFRKKKYDFHEKIYKHKHPSPHGVERQYIWEAERKETEYLLIRYKVYMHTYDAHDVEVVMRDGSRRAFTKGKLWVELQVEGQFDFEKRWERNSFYNHLRDFYNKYVIRKRWMQGYSPKHRIELFELQALVKERLKMESEGYEHRHMAGVHMRT